MKQPRVALFTGNYVHIKDGVSLTLNRLVGHLESRGIDVIVFGPGIKDRPIEPAGKFVEVPSMAMPGRPEYRITLFLPEVLRHEIDNFRPNLIHIATPDVLGLIALNYARKHRIPIISSYHTHFPSYLKYYNMGMLESAMWKYLLWFYSYCEKVVSPSKSMNDYLLHKGLEANKVGLWSRGIDSELFSPANRDETYRAELGFKPDEIVVSFISRLVWEKNLHTYIKAVKLAQKKNPKIRALIGGDGPIRNELEKELPNCVYVGYQSGRALARVYAASDVFLFPSESEAFGNVTLEAMASGVPALVADAVGSKSLVIDGETGYILPPYNVDSFATHLLKLAEDESLRKKLAAQARAHALKYDWDVIMDGLIADYADVLAFNGYN